jgi:hypothetical protein
LCFLSFWGNNTLFSSDSQGAHSSILVAPLQAFSRVDRCCAPYFIADGKDAAMDKEFQKDILGRLSRREFEDWTHCFRVLMEKLGKVARTKREANRVGMYITHELRRVVRIKQWKEGEARGQHTVDSRR